MRIMRISGTSATMSRETLWRFVGIMEDSGIVVIEARDGTAVIQTALSPRQIEALLNDIHDVKVEVIA